MAPERDPEPPEDPDVEIGATAKAKLLRFRKKPRVDVNARSVVDVHPELAEHLKIEGEGGSRADRENLPDEVEPGTTYRDVRVGWRAGARVRAREQGEG